MSAFGGPRVDQSVIVHGAAGAASSVVALGLLYPLDQLRTLQQLGVADGGGDTRSGLATRLRVLVKQQGVPGLYRGFGPSLFTLACSNFIFFLTYQAVKALLARRRRRPARAGDVRQWRRALENLCTSALAGVVTVLLTNPLWVVCMRIKRGPPRGCGQPAQPLPAHGEREDGLGTPGPLPPLSRAPPQQGLRASFAMLASIPQCEGVGALWKGTAASLALVSNPVIQFSVYESLKYVQLHKRRGRDSGGLADHVTTLTAAEGFVFGAVAKAAATGATYPLQLAQSHLRSSSQNGANQPGGDAETTLSCLARVWRDKGLCGWFDGIETKLLQSVLTSAFVLSSYETIISAVQSLGMQRQLATTTATAAGRAN